MDKKIYAETRYKVRLANGFILNLRGLDIKRIVKEIQGGKRFFTTPKGFCIHSAMVQTVEEVKAIDVLATEEFNKSQEISEEKLNKLEKELNE
ncbi:MAG: hypothetical protein PF440_05845 [Thiomicrorhabdus sp.]|jgi:hypothetical protein|nr:hypothetical protein [Thiomicrorhabdus sp.]